MTDLTKQKIKANLSQIKELFCSFLPQNRDEVFLLLGLIVFYSSYAFYIVVNTSVIDNLEYRTDTFFSFDAPEIFDKGYQSMIPHPLLQYFTSPIIFIGNLLTILFGTYKAKTVLWAAFCMLLISMSSVYIFRYLREITEIKKGVSLLITLMFAVMSTNLVLCFTPESYTISLFLLTFTLYYYSKCIKQNKAVTLLSNLTLATLLGGTTITNYAMGIIPMFYTKDNIRLTLKKVAVIACSIVLIFAWLQIQYDFIFDVKKRMLYFTTPRGAFYEHAIDWFFGAPVLLPKVIPFFNTVFNRNEYVVSMEFYHHWWQYLFVGITAFLLLFSIIKNRKNKYVQIITLFLSVNIFIHLIVKYGIDEPMIFGWHWIYVIPILFGWLYASVEGRLKTAILFLFSILFIALFVNNMFEMKNFVYAALDIFPAS